MGCGEQDTRSPHENKMTSCCSRVHGRENTLATHATWSTAFLPVLANCQAWFPSGLSSRILPQLSEIPVSGSLKTDQNPPLRVVRLISSCDICGAKTLPGRQMFIQPKQTEVSVHRTVLVRTEETVFFSPNQRHTFPRSCGCQSWDWVSLVHLLILSLPVSRPLNQLWNKPARAF